MHWSIYLVSFILIFFISGYFRNRDKFYPRNIFPSKSTLKDSTYFFTCDLQIQRGKLYSKSFIITPLEIENAPEAIFAEDFIPSFSKKDLLNRWNNNYSKKIIIESHTYQEREYKIEIF